MQPQGSQQLITTMAHSCDPEVHHSSVDLTEAWIYLDILDCILKLGRQSSLDVWILITWFGVSRGDGGARAGKEPSHCWLDQSLSC